jgi:hypothetical protein
MDATTWTPQTWLDRQAQVRRLRDLAREGKAIEQARVYMAYVQLAASPHFDTVLCSLLQRVMLRPIQNDVDRGKHDLLLSILHDLTNAVEGATQPLQGGAA